MHRSARVGLALVTAALAIGSAAACSDEDGDDQPQRPQSSVAATVGDRTIAEAEVTRSIDVLLPHRGGYVRAFGPPAYRMCRHNKRVQADATHDLGAREILAECKLEFGIAKAQALSFLLRAEWLTREASRRGLKPSRYDERLTSLRARSDDQQQVLLRRIAVSDQQVQRYGENNDVVYGQPEQRIVRIVQTSSSNLARQARTLIKEEGDWRQAVDRYAVRPLSRTWSGTHRVRASTAPQDAFGRGMFAARPGQLRGPVKTLNGWFVYEVVRVADPGSDRLSPQARRTILSTLRTERLSKTLHTRYAADTDCARKYRIPEVPECR